MKDSMVSTSGDSETKSTIHSLLSCRPESELRNDICAVALVSLFDDALVKLDETLDSSSCQIH